MTNFSFEGAGTADVLRTQLRSQIIDELGGVDRTFAQQLNIATERLVNGATIDGDVNMTCSCSVEAGQSYSITFTITRIPLDGE